MKKILMICNYFAPDSTIGAVRTSKLVKYFRKSGYEVDFITEKKTIQRDELLLTGNEDVNIEYAENSRVYLGFRGVYEKLISPLRKKCMARMDNRRRINKKSGNEEFYPLQTAYPLLGSADYIVEQIKQNDLFRSIMRILDKADKYDFLITSYGDSFAYYAGRYFKRMHPKTPWIMDIRDAIYRYKFTPPYVSFFPKNMEKRVWSEADCIVGVSKAICRRVSKKYRNKVHYIPNGYDPDDRIEVKNIEASLELLIFTYTGSMYGGLQDLSMFFKCMRMLFDDELIVPDKVIFQYAGNSSAYEIFKNQAQKYGVENVCTYIGKLTHLEAMNAQEHSDILLCASYDYKDNTGGIITGKIFEYMTAKKPVITVITGDIENSELASIVKKTGIGIAIEESQGQEGIIALREYILNQYHMKMKTGSLEYNPNVSELEKYDYSNIANQYIRLLDSLESKRGGCK